MMSFGGSVQAMISSLKNNSRDRKTLFDNKSLYRQKSSEGFKRLLAKRATPEQLAEIRYKLKRRNRVNTFIVIIFSAVLSICIGIFSFRLLF